MMAGASTKPSSRCFDAFFRFHCCCCPEHFGSALAGFFPHDFFTVFTASGARKCAGHRA